MNSHHKILLLLFVYCGSVLFCVDEEIEKQIEIGIAEPVKNASLEIINYSISTDLAYGTGGSIAQGFSVPALRFSLYGLATEALSYRVSFSQTKEWALANLPQILPSEAFLQFQNSEKEFVDGVQFKAGLMFAELHPRYSHMLSELALPDYFETHKRLLLGDDIGVQYSFWPISKKLKMTFGFFNGNGIYAQNTNNSKAGTFYVSYNIINLPVSLSIGSGSYFLRQSSQGSINYRSVWLSNIFLELKWKELIFLIECFKGRFEDSTLESTPTGGSAELLIPIIGSLKGYLRIESSSASFQSTRHIKHYEIGPVYNLYACLSLYFMYQYLESEGQKDNIVFLKARLSL